ncbi:hypothetical protein [Delftia sp. PS-11]|uniref:hypothetical protein n=1 Tax=Delftia sp. PS-11 TaxID=2767222 RepID=UPI003AB8015C
MNLLAVSGLPPARLAAGMAVAIRIGPENLILGAPDASAPDIAARSCDDFRSVQAVVQWIERHSEP